MNGVQTLVVPVLVILQNRVDHQQRNNQQQSGYNSVDAQFLEEVRNDWCALVGDGEMGNEAAAIVSEIIPIILLDSSQNSNMSQVPPVTSKNRDSVNQTVELNLASRYVDVINQFHRFGAPKPNQSQTVLEP